MSLSGEAVMEQAVETPQADSDTPSPVGLGDPDSVYYRMLELLPEVLDRAIGLVE
jgi:hypothetical protein